MWRESEIIDLASEGVFYPSDHPFSKGSVRIYPITGRCEELLCNATLSKKDLTLETLLGEVLEEKVEFNSILQCDIDSILLNLKIIGYGSETKFKITCSACDESNEIPISFSFKSKNFISKNFQRGKNEIQFTFPESEKTIVFRLPNYREQKILKNSGWLTFIKNQTVSIDGVSDIEYFIDYEMSINDGKSLKRFYEYETPGYHTKTDIKCPSCERGSKLPIDIDHNIFGFTPAHKKLIHSEIFDLCYHSNGAFTQDVVYDLPVNLRQFYIKNLLDLKVKEKEKNSPQQTNQLKKELPNRPKIKSN